MSATNREALESGTTEIFAAVLALQLSEEEKKVLETAVASGKPLSGASEAFGLIPKLRTGLSGFQSAVDQYYEGNGMFYRKWFPNRYFAVVRVDAFDLRTYGDVLDVFDEESISQNYAIGESISQGNPPGTVATFQITEDSYWGWSQEKTSVEYANHTPEQLKASYLKGKFFAAFMGFQKKDEVRPVLGVCSADERYPIELEEELAPLKTNPHDFISMEEITEESYRAYLADMNASVELAPQFVDMTSGEAVPFNSMPTTKITATA